MTIKETTIRNSASCRQTANTNKLLSKKIGTLIATAEGIVDQNVITFYLPFRAPFLQGAFEGRRL